MNSVMDPQGHFANYRAALAKALKDAQPCVPFLGVSLSDFTFIDEGNTDTIENKGNQLINFMKVRMMAQEYQRYRMCVSRHYQFTKNEVVIACLELTNLVNSQFLDEPGLVGRNGYPKTLPDSRTEE